MVWSQVCHRPYSFIAASARGQLKRRDQGFGDIFYLDEVFVNIQGVQQYLWRAVDQTVKLLMCFFRNDEMVRRLSVSLYAINRADLSHQATRVRERDMRAFKKVIAF